MIRMAYLRKHDETVEVQYSLRKVWTAVPKALASLEWNLEEIDEKAHRVKAKTRTAFMSYSSTLLIHVTPVSENTTRVTIAAETPVTSITAIVDFRQGERRIGLFFSELAKHLAT
jgi:hypothetical protein